MNKLIKKVSKDNLYSEYLKAMNGILHMTDREIELMSMLIDFDLAYDKSCDEPKNVISRENRKVIREKLGITSDNLSRYFTRFRREGFLVSKKDGSVSVNKMLIPEIIRDRIQVAVILYVAE